MAKDNKGKKLTGYNFFNYTIDKREGSLGIDDAFNRLSKDQQEKLLKELPEDKREELLKRLPSEKLAGSPAVQNVRAILEKFSAEGDNISVHDSSFSENINRIKSDDELSELGDISISDNKPNYDIKPDDQLSDISMSDIHLIDKDKSLDETLDTKPEEEKQQTPDDRIDFTTKPTLKELSGINTARPGFWNYTKRGAMGGARILLIPAATSIIFGCGFFVVLAFLFKVPTAAILDKIGFKKMAKDLLSGKEVELAQKVALTVFDFVYYGTTRDFGAHGSGLNELARTFDTTNEKYVDYKTKMKNKGKPIEPKSAKNLSDGTEFNKENNDILFTGKPTEDSNYCL